MHHPLIVGHLRALGLLKLLSIESKRHGVICPCTQPYSVATAALTTAWPPTPERTAWRAGASGAHFERPYCPSEHSPERGAGSVEAGHGTGDGCRVRLQAPARYCVLNY